MTSGRDAAPPGSGEGDPRWALVAGATGRVGHAVADALAAEGRNVVVHSGRRSGVAGDLARELADRYGVRALAVHADITDAGELDALREELGRLGVGSLAVLVNCVTRGSSDPASRLDGGEFRRLLDVDIVGPFLLVRTLLPLLEAERASRVVLLTARVGPYSGAATAHLSAAKTGVHGLVSAVAEELDTCGIRVQALSPGPIVVQGGSPPLGLPPGVPASTPEEVAQVVVELVSVGDNGPVGRLFGVHSDLENEG
jgi:3-oxoacyl-[acyl-carrier protein] reductase